ncbi:MAG: phospholipase D family protein [Ktedonobacteraceae bacterium]
MNGYKTNTDLWWVRGDMPVRTAPRLAFLVDGRMTMLEMCICFLSAKRTISITAFGLSPELLLVRGKQKCAGPAGSAEQEELLRWLRAKHLPEEALRFWQDCPELSVINVLGYMVHKGVTVRVLLWDTYSLPFQLSPKDVQKALEALGMCCLLDDSHMGLLNQPLDAHHQKTAIVDSRVAFVGGIDVMTEKNGEFDRWDTKGHPYHTPLRLNKDGNMPHSWHDVHVLFEGPAVADVERNFRERWNAVVDLHQFDPALVLPEPATTLSVVPANTHYSPYTENTPYVQVIRTIPKGLYRFAPEDGIATILETYQRAFASAKRFIYLENQYFWQRTFLGFENPALGLPHADMEGLLHTLAAALARGVVIALVLPDNPNVGREFTDEGLHALRELAAEGNVAGSLHLYTLASSLQQQGQTSYRSIYVHAKTTIVDDEWVTLGSANLNNRGMRDDTELNVAIRHSELAQRLRILLMAEHLGLCDEDILFQMLDTLARVQPHEETGRMLRFTSALKRWTRASLRPRMFAQAAVHLTPTSAHITDDLGVLWAKVVAQIGDPLSGIAFLAKQAQENLQAIKAGQPLVGHVLPYIPHNQAQDYDVAVHAVNGWLDSVPVPQVENVSAP